MPTPTPAPDADRRALLRALIECYPRWCGLEAAERAALEAIVCAPLSWSWVEPPEPALIRPMTTDLARLGIPGEAARGWLAGLAGPGIEPEALATLERAGLVERGTVGGGEVCTLSAVGAFHLAVELVEFGGDIDPETRWQPRGRPPMPIKLRRRVGEFDQDQLGLLADWRGDAADELERRRIELVIDRLTRKPVRLFQGSDGRGEGVPIARDRRIKPAKKRGGATSKGRAGAGKPARGRATPRARTTPGGFDLIDQHRARRAAGTGTG